MKTILFTNKYSETPLQIVRREVPEGFEIPVFTTQTGAFLTFALLSALVAAYKLNDEKKEAAAAKAKADAAKEAAKAAAASAAKVKEAA